MKTTLVGKLTEGMIAEFSTGDVYYVYGAGPDMGGRTVNFVHMCIHSIIADDDFSFNQDKGVEITEEVLVLNVTEFLSRHPHRERWALDIKHPGSIPLGLIQHILQ